MHPVTHKVLIAILLIGTHSLFASFPKEIKLEQQSIKKIGEGEYHYLSLFHVFSAAYYSNSKTPENLAEEEYVLILEYKRAIKATEFHEITSEGIRRRTDKKYFEKLKPSITEFNKLYKDISPGDRYQITYLNNTVSLSKNQKHLGSVKNQEFSRALLSIWLGQKPLNKKLKKKLLAK